MKGISTLLPRSLMVLLCSAVCAIVLACVYLSSHLPARKLNHNPQKFYLLSTGTSFTYSFTCDPHASDAWLFGSGGGNMIGPAPLAGITNLATSLGPTHLR